MTEYKILGSVFIAVGGIFSSFMLNKRLSSELEEVKAAEAFISYIREQIMAFSMPLNEIIKKWGKSRLEKCGYLFDVSDTAMLCDKLSSECMARNEDIKKHLESFFLEFGKNDRAEQIRVCDIYVKRLSDMETKLLEKIPAQRRVNTALCISGALALIIMML